jgi:Glycosyl transferase family 2
MTALALTLQTPTAPLPLPARAPVDVRAHEAVLDVVIPVYNEQTDLPGCVRRLHAHLTWAFPYTFRITVADNASTDRTLAVAHELARELPRVRVVHLPRKGRGRAPAAVWPTSDVLQVRFSDAQCGFRAVRREAAEQLLPLVEDTGWFFDTELLVLAELSGLRIHEVPVDWVDDPDSRVDIVATAVADLKGVARVLGGLAGGRIPVDRVRARLGRVPLAA